MIEPSRVVCILGMHRSGTSLVAEVVHALGVDLGPEERLMPPTAFNPRGYWEYEPFGGVSEEILERYGGSWHEPPELPPGWERDPALEDLREHVRRLVRDDFGHAERWAWKDPRTCLTLPFWRDVVSLDASVLCVRSPVEVADSLTRRDGFPQEKGVTLWLRYMADALEHSAAGPRLLLFYEDLLQEPERELRRVARFLGTGDLADDPAVRSAVEEAVSPELRHHGTSPHDVVDAGIRFEAKALYLNLRAEVNRDQEAAGETPGAPDVDRAVGRLFRERATIGGETEPSDRAEIVPARPDQDAAEERDERIAHLEAEVHRLTGSPAYRLLSRLRRLADRAAPWGTRRRSVVLASAEALRVVSDEGWGALGRRAVRVHRWLPRLFRPAGSVPEDPYARWLATEVLPPERLRAMRRSARRLPYAPTFSLLVPVSGSDGAALDGTLRSLRGQAYGRWEAILVPTGPVPGETRDAAERHARRDRRIRLARPAGRRTGDALNAALERSVGELVAVVEEGALLKPNALFAVAEALGRRGDLDYLYTDEDVLGRDGAPTEPFFKPGWSADLATSSDYACRLGVCRRAVLEEAGGFRDEAEGDHLADVVLRVAEVTDHIGHLPLPVYTRTRRRSVPEEARLRVLRDALRRRGYEGTAEAGRLPDRYRVRYAIKGSPKVTILVPTKDNVELLRACVDGIRQRTTYRNHEVVIVDNRSVKPKTLSYLEAYPGRVLPYPHPFNFARMMNTAAREVGETDLLLFLNNDTEVISPGWLEAMVEHGQRREVAAVGARLLFPDGRPQHEGIVVGLEHAVARNVDHRGYAGLGESVRNCSAVTAACMLIRPEVFWELGGFDERLSIAYNDVDLCLRAREKGYLIVYTPHAELYHQEGSTRGGLPHEDDERFFRERWGEPGTFVDPYYNPNLDLDRPFTPRFAP